MKRCEHGVMIPAWVSGSISPYCSGCETPKDGLTPYPDTYTPFPYGERKCPVCESKDGFKYADEDKWHCMKCGADASNI